MRLFNAIRIATKLIIPCLLLAMASAVSCSEEEMLAHGEECSSDDECRVRCECGVCSNGNAECGDGGDGECAEGFSCTTIASDALFCVKGCSSAADCPGDMTCDSVINQCTFSCG